MSPESRNQKNTRAEQARINGAKSKGPKTEAGKIASSRNAIKHGLTSSILSVREDPEEFAATLAAWTSQLRPETEAERRLVRRIAIAEFRLERIVLIETNLLDAEIDCREDALEDSWTGLDDAGRMALCFRDANRDASPFELLRRYEAMFDRSIARNVRLLLDLQKERREQEKAPQQVESESQKVVADKTRPLQNEPRKITPCVSAGLPTICQAFF